MAKKTKKKNENGTSLKINIVDAYIIYKTKRDGLDFDYVATDDELKQLGQYFIDNADKEHKLSFEDIYEIDRKMAIVGCRNFITDQDLRSIVASSIDTSDKVGITYGFYQTFYHIIKRRSNEIPQVLIPLDCEITHMDTINHFIAKLNQITEEKDKKNDYIVQNGKIYRYVGDV